MKRVLILTTAGQTVDKDAILGQMLSGLNAQGDMFNYAYIQDVVFKITNGVPSILLNGEELAGQVDCVHVRNNNNFTEYANALRLYADEHGIILVNREDSILPYFGKLSQGFLFAFNNVPTPDFICSYSNSTLLKAIADEGWTYPFVIKHVNGMRGMDNYLVHEESDLDELKHGNKSNFMAQPFIANDGELRVLTFGSALPPLVFQKKAVEGQYLNNTSQGGQSTLLEADAIDEAIMADAMQAASLTNREIGGVDVLMAKDGSHVILEVNSTPAIATGVYLDKKIALYRQFFDQEA